MTMAKKNKGKILDTLNNMFKSEVVKSMEQEMAKTTAERITDLEVRISGHKKRRMKITKTIANLNNQIDMINAKALRLERIKKD